VQCARLAGRLHLDGAASLWFFIRYRDPDDHIRLRFKGTPESLVDVVLPEVVRLVKDLEARGLVGWFAVGSYERELLRYGGSTGLSLAEQFFCGDSIFVAEAWMLGSSPRPLALDSDGLSLLSIWHLMRCFDAAGVPCVDDVLRDNGAARRSTSEEYRAGRHRFYRFVCDHEFDTEHADQRLKRALARRRRALSSVAGEIMRVDQQGRLHAAPKSVFASLVHMHCNRILGVDRAAEARAMGLVLRLREWFRSPGRNAFLRSYHDDAYRRSTAMGLQPA